MSNVSANRIGLLLIGFSLFTLVPLAEGNGRLTYQTVHGTGLEGNLLGDSPNRQVMVYLPPSYTTAPTRHYPAIYLLHGHNSTNTIWRDGAYQGFNILTAMDRLIEEGKIREMIVVMPDGRNAYGGAYFVNSSVTGNWEDFVTEDLVSYIDTAYRTIPVSSSRGIAGQSMGGYSAIYIAMRNPDVFSAVFAMRACCLDMVAEVAADYPEWVATLGMKNRQDLVASHLTTPSQGNYPNAITALAAALSPNPEKPPLFVDFPFELVNGNVQPNESAYHKWKENFPVYMVDAYRSNLLKLKGIHFTAGISDRLAHIPLGSRAFSHALTKAAIPHVFEMDSANHRELVREWIETRALPFFSLLLTHQSLISNDSE